MRYKQDQKIGSLFEDVFENGFGRVWMEVEGFDRRGLLGESVCLWILWEEGCSLIGVLGRDIASDCPTFV